MTEETTRDISVEKTTETLVPESVESMEAIPEKTADLTYTTKAKEATLSICKWQQCF